MKDKILFVHIQRSAGTTFRRMLESVCRVGANGDHRHEMYTNPQKWANIETKEQNLYEKFDVLRGHFPYQRFYYLKKHHGWNMVTWIRDPVERIISHYFKFSPVALKKLHPKVENLIRPMDIVEFSSFLSNLNTRYIGKDPSIFDFIGVVEEFDKSLEMFNEQFNCNLQFEERFHIGMYKKEVSEEVREELKQHHLEDYEFYNKVIKRYKNKERI